MSTPTKITIQVSHFDRLAEDTRLTLINDLRGYGAASMLVCNETLWADFTDDVAARRAGERVDELIPSVKTMRSC